MRRNRVTYFAGVVAVILLGLASRAYSPPLPAPVREYAGDALWALAAYLTLALLFPRLAVGWVAAAAGLLSLAVELSQLYHAPWLDEVRRTRLGGLALGHGFLWSDLVCYAAGVAAGALSDGRRARRGSAGGGTRAGADQ